MGCKREGQDFFCYLQKEEAAWPLLFQNANCQQKKYGPDPEKIRLMQPYIS